MGRGGRIMCGIFGYYCFADNRPDKERISDIFLANQPRGKDAAGYAYIQEGKLHVVKAPGEAVKLLEGGAWEKLELPQILIGHTRAATTGSAENNLNNHPLYDKSGW